MKIAYNAILLGGYFSGVEVTVSRLGELLAHEFAHDLHVFMNSQYSDRGGFANAEVCLVGLPMNSRLSRIFWEHFVMPCRVRKLKCDLLHCPGYIAPVSQPCPTVLTVHDVIALKRPDLCKISNQLYYKLMLGRSIAAARQVVVPGENVKNDIVRIFGTSPEKINVIPFAASEVFSPVVEQDILEQVRIKYRLPHKFILFLANHEPKKNIAGVIRTFAEFRKEHKDYKLVLAGRAAWGTKEASKLSYKLAIERDIIWPGFIPIADLLAVYSLADVFLFPSFEEGFGIPLLEAMACGLPVVCSDCEGLKETSAGAAVCVPADSHVLMAEKMSALITDKKLREKYVNKGFARARELTWEKTLKATVEVYHKALGG
ncbi:MAG: glycosyltransferase family 4 protein [Victivallales bacterium]|nr:glycosyltransferase family 4 protein [Victivallales bacterium]